MLHAILRPNPAYAGEGLLFYTSLTMHAKTLAEAIKSKYSVRVTTVLLKHKRFLVSSEAGLLV